MKQLILILTSSLLLLQACAQSTDQTDLTNKQTEKAPVTKLPEIKHSYTLTDFLSENKQLDQDVDALYQSLDDTAIVAQLIMPAVGRLGNTPNSIKALINRRAIGGVLMLNG